MIISTPEWSIFDRLDELEDITLKLMEQTEVKEPNLKDTSTAANDANILAKQTLIFAFIHWAATGHSQRETKDRIISILKKTGLSEKMLDSVEGRMTEVCEFVEKRKH